MKFIKIKTKNEGFTLVELIVLITILGILGVIGFNYMQGYVAESRNSKRTVDLRNISNNVGIKLVSGSDIKSFVSGTSAVINSSSAISISGVQGYSTLSGVYTAGDVNYTFLGMRQDSFSDPITNGSYKIGVTSINNQYEIAATIEEAGYEDILVVGNWVNRYSGTGHTTTARGERKTIVGDTFYLSGMLSSDTLLRVGDTVGISTGVYVINKMNDDSITVDRVIDTLGANIFLKKDETRHLIKKYNSNSAIDYYTGSTKNTPYTLNLN